MPIESDFFHDKKKRAAESKFRAAFFCHFLNFELIAVSVIKSSLAPVAYPLLRRKSLFFDVNESK
jgi:hypothetical protein